MTIEKGVAWGTPGRVPEGAALAGSDPAVAECATGEAVIVTGGDLHRGLGQPHPKNAGDDCMLLPVDAMAVTITTPDGDSTVRRAVAHVCVGRFGGRHGFAGVINAGFMHGLNLAPRGHPGDGQVELVVVDRAMPWRQRRLARRRARTGSHVPHPAINISAVHEWTHEQVNREVLYIDGLDAGAWRKISVAVVPGHFVVVV